ncbi:hypothetical protein [Pseudomonas sp. Sample_23]|jgi:hypothetical protein|uniref:hypothetical protein n=1 Tax=Pseudomonas sp. Sample_23 TaxID=2448267 RepID=UPI0010328484|nr:hypothetical protein [Pseudomonas sp. Sample_23]
MRIARLFTPLCLAVTAGLAQADTCPVLSGMQEARDGSELKDSFGRIWKVANPNELKINRGTEFESVTHITEDEDETGPILVNQISCRYGNIALVADVAHFESTSSDWTKTGQCTVSLTQCSYSTNE